MGGAATVAEEVVLEGGGAEARILYIHIISCMLELFIYLYMSCIYLHEVCGPVWRRVI